MAGCKNNSFILLQFNDSERLQRFSNHFFKVETETLFFANVWLFQGKEKLFLLFWAFCVQSEIEVDLKKNNNQQLKI